MVDASLVVSDNSEGDGIIETIQQEIQESDKRVRIRGLATQHERPKAETPDEIWEALVVNAPSTVDRENELARSRRSIASLRKELAAKEEEIKILKAMKIVISKE